MDDLTDSSDASAASMLQRTQRWVFDLQACQTSSSARRGVGRYSQALFAAVREVAPLVDCRALVNPDLPHGVDLPSLTADRILQTPALPPVAGRRKADGGPQDDLDAVLLSHRVAPWKADLIHVSHVFEGHGERVALPSPSYRAAGQVLSATLYDLIPLRFPAHYFSDAGFERWYRSRLDWLRQADLLLAISESSRQDAIDLLGIDPARIVTVHGGVGPHFVPTDRRDMLRTGLARRYGLRDRFVLYTGGDDHRKNLAGGIRGYAAVPASARRNCQLVLVCSLDDGRKAMYRAIGRRAGLADDELVITGFVPEDDLVTFYQCCDAFFFPSLYEGLGLPVLEAMACGAPTIGGDNSSIRELIGRADAMFDARSTDAIAHLLTRVLDDRSFARELSDYGPGRAAQFGWRRSATRAVQAMTDAVMRVQHAGTAAVANGWVPKKRLAVLTPLPPCRSGIADYNARFLPFLARHFDIDLVVDDYAVNDVGLSSVFAVLTAAQFERVAPLYDAILYEFGNSEFHRYMLPLLARFPGVVGLHDAYLSGLIGYTAARNGDGHGLARAMIEAHGAAARRLYAPAMHHPDPNGAAYVDLPCTKQVIDQALGLISHSPFNLEVTRYFHPEGWRAPYRIISQMVQRPPPAVDRDALRAKFGFSPTSVVIVTLGHVVWTKWGDRLLAAFLASRLRDDPDAHLIYVGELLHDDFGRRLADDIVAAGLGERVRITGFLDDEAFARHLQAADIAVQLRTKSRGGTPKGVLDCLACGVPVIVNDDASYRDYPDDVVHKLPAAPTVDEIADALDVLGTSADRRNAYAERGRRHVAEEHDPGSCARLYAAAIHEFVERHRLASDDTAAERLAPLLARCDAGSGTAREVARIVAERPQPTFRKRCIYIDVSCTSSVDLETGIQRVVKKIVHHGYTADRTDVDVVAVELTAGRLHVASRWLTAKGLLYSGEADSIAPDRTVRFAAGDVLFMLDSSWARYPEFFASFAEARRAGATVVTAVYDLLPLQLPDGFIVDGGPAWFRNWVVSAVNASDALIAISRSVALDVQDFIDAQPGLPRVPKVGWWHLGSDIADTAAASGSSSDEADRTGPLPYLLMVGTIEPRKSHALVVRAMERLWARGVELALCIAGKQGWLVDDFMQTLRAHPQLGDRLRFFEHPTDAEITRAYQGAAGLLFISKGEGFGLPLVEAANHGTPILCSDLPVFREICGDHATYVDAWQPEPLAAAIEAWWVACQRGGVPQSRDMPRLTWAQSAAAVLDVIVHERWLVPVDPYAALPPPPAVRHHDWSARFNHQVGRRRRAFGSTVIALREDDRGFALYGPYVPLPYGRHAAVFTVYTGSNQEAPDDPAFVCDVTSHAGAVTHGSATITRRAVGRADCWLQFEVAFDLEVAVDAIEARCFTHRFDGLLLGHLDFEARTVVAAAA